MGLVELVGANGGDLRGFTPSSGHPRPYIAQAAAQPEVGPRLRRLCVRAQKSQSNPGVALYGFDTLRRGARPSDQPLPLLQGIDCDSSRAGVTRARS